MLNLYKKYRTDYAGEDIVTERKHVNRVWADTLEFVPNSVVNNQISNRAVVIGNGLNRADFDLNLFKKPTGLLGEYTLQTYGCNALHRDFTPDFLVATGNNGIVKEIADSGFTEDNIVYTSAIHLLEFPSKFYLIPYDPYADAGTTAAYIAAFDGHKKIFLLGFDGQDAPGINHNVYAGTAGYDPYRTNLIDDQKWVDNKVQLFNVYDDVEFLHVTPYGRNLVPQAYKNCVNYRQISFRDFVLAADL